MFGKLVSALQSDVEVDESTITGTLFAVTGYTGFSGDPSEQSGHYLALKFTAAENAVVQVELVGGTVGHPVTLDEDMNIVIRITDPENQAVKVIVTEGNKVMTKIYDISGLTLE